MTDLERAGPGTFDFFLDVGCFEGLNSAQRIAEGRGVSAFAKADAMLLMLEFGATRLRSVIGGLTREEVEAAFPAWELLSVDPAVTVGLGWPMNKTTPQWYRLRRPADLPE